MDLNLFVISRPAHDDVYVAAGDELGAGLHVARSAGWPRGWHRGMTARQLGPAPAHILTAGELSAADAEEVRAMLDEEAHDMPLTGQDPADAVATLVADGDTLRLYIVSRDDLLDVDEVHAVLVAAWSEDTARALAATRHRDEGPGAWWMPSTTVRLVGVADPSITTACFLLADQRDG